jgi:hypothetical protein
MTDETSQVDVGNGNNMDEKMDEKQYEKQHEKVDEKSFDEKNRSDPLSSVVWALILIWAGAVLLASNLGILNTLPVLGEMSVWAIACAGAGMIILGEVVIRLLVPKYSGPVVGSLIFALILLGIGVGDLVHWAIIWPTIVIAVGVLILFRALFRSS